MDEMPEIEFEEIAARDGHLGLITLTRTQVLNALSQPMFTALNNQLTAWENTNHIKAVIIRAAEGSRAFSAGGDIRSVYERRLKNDPHLTEFFREEYLLNRHIHHYTKPYIALMDGITMGGGVGISIHASHRVATTRLVFAMPETGIGFYPDVGSDYYLSRLPDCIGIYLGMTGARINLADCAALGLIDQPVQSDIFPELLFALADAVLEDDINMTISTILKQFAMLPAESELLQHGEEIAHCFAKKTVKEIIHELENYPSQWCQDVAANLKTKSPTSLKVTLQALHLAETLEFDDCIKMDYRLTTRFAAGTDFFEGIRAVLIDKDQMPNWQPSRLEDVSASLVNEYFAPVGEELF